MTVMNHGETCGRCHQWHCLCTHRQKPIINTLDLRSWFTLYRYEHPMNEIKENARRLLVAHGFSDVAETTDGMDSNHKIRVLVLTRCAPAGLDLGQVTNNPSFASGAFAALVATLDEAKKPIDPNSLGNAPSDRSIDQWHDTHEPA